MFSLAVDAADLATVARLVVAKEVIDRHVAAEFDNLETQLVAAVQEHMHFDKGYSQGELESSVTAQRVSETEVEVSVGTDHAAYVEYGTGQRGAGSDVSPPDGYAYGGKPGMEAEPYLAPTMQDMQPSVEVSMEEAIGVALDELAHG